MLAKPLKEILKQAQESINEKVDSVGLIEYIREQLPKSVESYIMENALIDHRIPDGVVIDYDILKDVAKQLGVDFADMVEYHQYRTQSSNYWGYLERKNKKLNKKISLLKTELNNYKSRERLRKLLTNFILSNRAGTPVAKLKRERKWLRKRKALQEYMKRHKDTHQFFYTKPVVDVKPNDRYIWCDPVRAIRFAYKKKLSDVYSTK